MGMNEWMNGTQLSAPCLPACLSLALQEFALAHLHTKEVFVSSFWDRIRKTIGQSRMTSRRQWYNPLNEQKKKRWHFSPTTSVNKRYFDPNTTHTHTDDWLYRFLFCLLLFGRRRGKIYQWGSSILLYSSYFFGGSLMKIALGGKMTCARSPPI